MSKKRRSEDYQARFISAGGALHKLDKNWRQLDPTKETILKSFSVKYDGYDFFVILRGSYGGDDVVQFFRCEELESLPALILQKLAQGEWKKDKYGGIR